MAFKPKFTAQLSTQTGMGRPGGIASKASTVNPMSNTAGAGFAAMENTLLKGASPSPKSLSGGQAGRQFSTKAAGGDLSGTVGGQSKVFNLKKPKTQ